MVVKDKRKNNARINIPRTTLISLLVMLLSLGIILATGEIAKLHGFEFVAQHRNTIVNSELTVFAIILVEFIGKAIILAFKSRGIEPVGHSIRTIMRGAVYVALAIGIVSSLSSNPGLAISIGTVTGIIIAFATQNLVGNIIAGIMIAIVRPVRVGDQITILTSSGQVKEIALMYTILGDGENLYYVPSMVIFSNIVMRKRTPLDRFL